MGSMKVYTWIFGSREVRPTVALMIGIVLILLGAWMIFSARHMHSLPLSAGATDLIYYDWNMNSLLTGIALALVGTSVATASETYRLVTRKLKEV